MNIKSILKAIGLGAAGVGATVADAATGGALTPITSKVIDAISSKIPDPALQAQVQQAATAASEQIQQAEIAYAQNVAVAVNATMQAEAKSTSWLQQDWRPIFGLTAAFVIFNNYIILPYFAHMGLLPVQVPGDVWNIMLAVLGIGALGSGAADVVNANKGNNN